MAIKIRNVIPVGLAPYGSTLTEINRLIPQQSLGTHRSLSNYDLQQALGNPNFRLYIALDDTRPAHEQIVGMASIFFQRNLTRWIAEVHDVVVDECYRGQGIGRMLMERLIAESQLFARDHAEKIKLYLTSRPSRLAANALYQKLGFTLVAQATGEWGTNLYKMMIIP